MKKFFITGTGTNIGKTYVTRSLLRQYSKNYQVIGAKPIAAGLNESGLNDDITELIKSQNMNLSYKQLNLYQFNKLNDEKINKSLLLNSLRFIVVVSFKIF